MISQLLDPGLQLVDLVYIFFADQLQFPFVVQLALCQLNPQCLYHIIDSNYWC